jgi:predicted nucleotidyltransferase
MTTAREYVRRHGKPDDKIVREIVRRVVEVAEPDKVILFGSAARGEMGPDSDLDFLVIKSGDYNRSKLEGDLYAAMNGVGLAADFILVTPQQVERYKHSRSLIIYPALNEGVEVYDHSTLSV